MHRSLHASIPPPCMHPVVDACVRLWSMLGVPPFLSPSRLPCVYPTIGSRCHATIHHFIDSPFPPWFPCSVRIRYAHSLRPSSPSRCLTPCLILPCPCLTYTPLLHAHEMLGCYMPMMCLDAKYTPCAWMLHAHGCLVRSSNGMCNECAMCAHDAMCNVSCNEQ